MIKKYNNNTINYRESLNLKMEGFNLQMMIKEKNHERFDYLSRAKLKSKFR